jgi:hypothetical protein
MYWELLAELAVLTPGTVAESQLQRWIPEQHLSSSEPEYNGRLQTKALRQMLGYPANATIPSIVASLEKLRVLLVRDGTQRRKLWYQASRFKMLPSDEAVFQSLDVRPVALDFDSKNAARAVNNWGMENSDGLLPSLVEQIGQLEPQYSNAALAAMFSASAKLPQLDIATVGEGYYPTPLGERTQRAAHRYPFFSDPTTGISGVALHALNRPITIYLFTAPSTKALSTFFTTLTEPAWQGLRSRFRTEAGVVGGGFTLGSRIMLSSASVGSAFVTRLGRAPFPPVLQSVVFFDPATQTIEIASSAVTTTAQPPCCFDYPSSVVVPPQFIVNLPVDGMIVEDSVGLILFMGFGAGYSAH